MIQSIKPPIYQKFRQWGFLLLTQVVLLVLLTLNLNAQIVINEVSGNGTVELKNTGTSMVNVSNYWLCDFPAYTQLSNLNLVCGSMNIAPGEILAIEGFTAIDENDAELGLYSTNGFGNSNNIVDYIEWGSTGHTRSGVAVAAGVWTAGAFIPSFGANETIAFDGEGDNSSDYTIGASTFCDENDAPAVTVDGGTLTGGPFVFCVDGNADNVSGIQLNGNSGANSAWVITDDQGNILGLPPMPGVVNFDEAGAGVCLIWNLSYEDGLTGLEAGNNVDALMGDFDLSNSITVYREIPDGGTVQLVGGATGYTGTAGNIVLDVEHTTSANFLSYWYIITDADDNILEFANAANTSTLDLSGAPAGECHVWGWSYRGLEDPIQGDNISTLNDDDCEAISTNFITVIREEAAAVDGGTLTGGPFVFCVDGNADNVSGIELTGNTGANSAWVITDDQGNILGLPPMPGVVNFDDAGAGVCLIWNLSYEDGLTGLAAGNNVNALMGDFDLSNSITVYRETPDGGTVQLAGGATEYTGTAGNIVLDVEHSTTAPNLSYWYIITDADDNILEFANAANTSTLDLSGAPAGECHIWGWSYRGLEDPIQGDNISTLNDDDCEAISTNFITVIREEADDCTAEGGTLTGGPFEFIVGDGIEDNVSGITLEGNTGSNSQWVVTDANGYILGLPPMPSVVNFDGAGYGTCLIWHLSFEDGLQGAAVGLNANNLQGCFSLSNPVTVIRNAADGCNVNGGELFGGPFEFTAGDGVADNIPAGAITLANAGGPNSQWVVTDSDGYILGLPPSFTGPNFDGAGYGTCLVWHLSFEDGLQGAAVGLNANNLQGCFSLSNPVTVIRNAADGCNANGGELFGGPFEFTVGDGIADNIPAGAIILANAGGANSQWVVTDSDGYILGLPPSFTGPNFDDAGYGTCLIWHLSFEDGLQGAAVGLNANNLQGCFSLSNPVTVIRNAADGCNANGGELFGGPFEFTVGDGIADNIPAGAIILANAGGANSQWIVTDDQGNILGLPPMPSVVDFDGAGTGVCLVWHLFYDDGISGLEAGANAADLEGCFSLSNSIAVTRNPVTSIGVDLSLDIYAESNLYTQFENTSFVFTATNEGTETATNIEIDATFPEGLVYVSHFATAGSLELAWQGWVIPSLAPGETATLNLTLFALVDNQDIEYFTQVIALDQTDIDSTPDSSNGDVTEDDEASVTIAPKSEGGFGTNSGNNDLELSISTQYSTYDIYEVVRYRIEVKNNGSETATGVVVNAGLPEGMVFTNATVNNGDYNLFFEKWMIEFIGAGQTATLDLDLFTLVSGQDITNFVQIFNANEQDPDSTPGNSNGTVNEDDEAAVTITYADGANENQIQSRSLASKMMKIEQAYPNPATDFIMLPILSEIDLQTKVNVIDVNGRVVSSQTMAVFEGYNRLNIGISDLSPGVYFISLDNLDITSTNRRFVKVSE